VSEYLCRAVQFGILEQPSIPFSSGEVMNPIPQTPEDLAFGREDLRAGCQKGIYEEVTTGEAERIRSTGATISSSFVVWQDGPEGRKGRFVVNLSKQSKHWPKRRVRMKTLSEYALELEHGEKIVLFDIQATLSARSADERLVLVQVRRAFLQVHRPSVRMGPEPDVVYSTYGTHGPKFKATLSSSRVLGRHPDMSGQGREGSQYERLPEGDTGDRQAALIIRLDTASDEVGMGREYSGRTPWLRDRLGSHAFLHSASKNRHGTLNRAGYVPASTARAAVSFEGQVTIVLWCMRHIVAGNALCLLLHQEFVRRHDQRAQGRSSIKEWESLPVESSVDKGRADVEEIGSQRDRRTPNSTAPNQRNNAH
jgi:hypothetical protein